MPQRVFIAGPVSWNQLVYLDRLPEPRPQMVTAAAHRETVGGTSAGKALNLAELGVEVALRTVVGTDEAAERVLGVLRGRGVRLFADSAGGRTERHLNLMDPQGGRLSIYLDVPDTDVEARPSGAAAAALAAADVAVIDLAEHARPWLAAAGAAGVPIWCDVHDYDGRSAWHAEFVDTASVLFLNDDGMADPVPFLRARVAAGASIGVVTRGAAGATAVTADAVVDVPAAPVARIVDTNGAGDAFFAGFLHAHLDGADVPAALRAGAEQAARCLGSTGLAPGVD